MKYILSIDRLECIGCGNCVKTCPKLFVFQDDGHSSLKDIKLEDFQKKDLEDLDCARMAAEACPMNCIHVKEDGKQVV